MDDPNAETFIITVDCTDCKVWEVKHHTFPIDRGYCSQKFNHAGLKYELAVAVFHDNIVWVNGPFKATRHDITVFHEDGLKNRMPPGKKVIADLGYRTTRADEVDMIALPNASNTLALKKFKSIARSRHETVNGRIKTYSCMFEEFHHGQENHAACFFAICVIVQYCLEAGDACLSAV